MVKEKTWILAKKSTFLGKISQNGVSRSVSRDWEKIQSQVWYRCVAQYMKVCYGGFQRAGLKCRVAMDLDVKKSGTFGVFSGSKWDYSAVFGDRELVKGLK